MLKTLLRIGILGCLLAVSIVTTGCAKVKPTLRPIGATDVVALEKGQSFTVPEAGWFMSDMYVEEIMKVKIES